MTAFADLLDLRTAVVEEVGDASIVDKFTRLVLLAEKRIGRELRTRYQITSTSITIASGVATAPTGFAQAIGLFDSTGCEYLQRPYQIKGQTSIYGEWSLNGTQIVGPNGDYTLIYYAKPSTITSGMDGTNDILANYPGVYLWTVMTEAYKTLKRPDEAVSSNQIAAMEIEAANSEDISARYARSAVRVQGNVA